MKGSILFRTLDQQNKTIRSADRERFLLAYRLLESGKTFIESLKIVEYVI